MGAGKPALIAPRLQTPRIPADQGSPIADFFEAPRCYWQTDLGLQTYMWPPFTAAGFDPALNQPSWDAPDWFNAMGYNGQRGPMVFEGLRREAFSTEQIAIIWSSLYACDHTASIPQLLRDMVADEQWMVETAQGFTCRGENEDSSKCYCTVDKKQLFVMTRAEARVSCEPRCGQHQRILTPACASGDVDRDGRCDDVDTCLENRSENAGMGLDERFLVDEDGDGIAEPCDPCDHDPTPGLADLDYDGDGLYGLCDLNQDGDDCIDFLPGGIAFDDDPTSATIIMRHDTCGPVVQSANLDHDGDGLIDCFDRDDDNDGTPDVDDDCNYTTTLDCMPHVCGDDVIRLAERRRGWQFRLSDPEDTTWMPDRPLDVIAIVDGQLFLRTGWDETANEQVLRVGNDWRYSAGSGVSLELSLVMDTTVVAEWLIDRTLVDMNTTGHGRLVAITLPTKTEASTTLRSTWALPGAKDTDKDTVPDVLDNCTFVANKRQFDHDRDGFGDMCDADLDNDGTIEGDDVEWIYECLDHAVRSADLMGPIPMSDDEAERTERCNQADLDGDGLVTETGDYAGIYKVQVGGPPGPSALAEAE